MDQSVLGNVGCGWVEVHDPSQHVGEFGECDVLRRFVLVPTLKRRRDRVPPLSWRLIVVGVSVVGVVR